MLASSTAGKPTNPFVATNEISTKVFGLPTGGTAPATSVAKLHIYIRAPSNIVDILPTLEATLLSGSKFDDAGYIAVYDANEVNFHEKIAVTITEKAVLHGYQCPRANIWRFPLQPVVINENTDTEWPTIHTEPIQSTIHTNHLRPSQGGHGTRKGYHRKRV